MNTILRANLDHLYTGNSQAQNKAYTYLLEAADKPVDWAYEIWDEMVAGLQHKDLHVRAMLPRS